jgi:hypothetical protein
MVRQLVVEGFLDDPKNVPEIRDHLASAKGRHFQPKAIHTAVLRLLRDNEIVRASGDDGYRYSRRR